MRPAWALGLGWLKFACAKGYGGPINWFLSLSIWKLPARLSYAVYLVHFTLILAVNSSSSVQSFFSVPKLIFDASAFLFITTIIAFVITVTIDAPFSTLTKLLLIKELCQRKLSSMKVNNTVLMMRFLDASARIPRAILLGNTLDLGNYHQCLNILEYVEDMNVQGKYCMVHVSLNQSTLMLFLERPFVDLEKDDFNRFTIYERLEKRLQAVFGMQSHDTRISSGRTPLSNINLRLAICVPESCTPREAVEALFFNITEYNINLEEQFCRLPNDKPWAPSDYIAIIIFSSILFIVTLSTCFDVWNAFISKKDTGIRTIYSCFSVYTNTRRLVTFKPGAEPLHCIDGIRALAMFWVVLGHTFLSMISSVNVLETFQWATTTRAMWVTSATITVDTFFMLSGLLIVYSTAGKLSSMQLLKNIHLFYLNRLLRMFPILAAMILYEASFLNRVLDGPKWNDMVTPILNCRQYWWSALLHIQNLYNPLHACLAVSWYLSVDVQLHILSPIILVWVLTGKKNIAWTALIAGFLITLVAASIYNFINDFGSGLFANNVHELERYFAYYYSNTLTRASPFLVGMIFGYILHLCKGKYPHIPKAILLTTWTFALLVLAGVIYCVPLNFRDGWDNQLADNLLNSYMRPAWALGLGWLIFACVKGYGAMNSSSSVQPYFSIPKLIFDTTAFLFITTIIAFVVTVTIDAPFATLTKLLLTKDNRKTNNKK
ncbi:unnamed protein product, partial [Iphiclides podalirius]